MNETLREKIAEKVKEWREGKILAPHGQMQLHGGKWVAQLCADELESLLTANEMRDLLESVARDMHYTTSAMEVLTRRLLPLLEAGQAMRDNSGHNVPFDSGEAEAKWDAAKTKALGGK